MNPAVNIRRAQPSAARSPAGAVCLLLFGALAVGAAACASDGGGPGNDASLDARSNDMGFMFLDAATDFASPRPDGGAVDAAEPRCVTTICDPRRATACGVDAMNGCRLSAAGPVCEGSVGTARVDGACMTADDCAAGLDCFATRDGTGKCARPCCPGDDSMCDVGGR